MTKPTYNRARVMKTAHAEWARVKNKPGMTFGKCLSLSWKVEKERARGRQYYNPDPHRIAPHIIATQSAKVRDIIRL